MPKPNNAYILLQKPLTDHDVFEIAELLDGALMGRRKMDGFIIRSHPDAPGEEKQYFSVIQDKGKRFFAIERGAVDGDDLVVALLKLPPKYADFRAEAMRAFGLPEPEARHYEQLKAEVAAKDARIHSVETAKTSLPKVSNHSDLPIDPKRTVKVGQSEMRVLGRGDPHDTLVTDGMGPCIAVLAVNTKNGRIGMAHIASSSDLYLVRRMHGDMQSDPENPIDPVNVVLWGGRPDRSERLAALILERLKRCPGVKLQSADICDPERKASGLDAIALNRKGEIRLEQSEVVRRLMPAPGMQWDDSPETGERLDGLLREMLQMKFQRVEPTSIKPGSKALEHGDMGRGRVKGKKGSNEPSPIAE